MTSLGPSSIFQTTIDEHAAVIRSMSSQRSAFDMIAREMAATVLRGNKILWCGNGGSAADSQHLATELLGRFRRARRGLPSIALTTDTSALTAIGNDFGFDRVFARQIEALCNPGDVVVGISTSGNSKNVCAALEAAKQLRAFTVALTGEGGGAMAEIADAVFCVPSRETARIQEGHILCGHMLCDWVESEVCSQVQSSQPEVPSAKLSERVHS